MKNTKFLTKTANKAEIKSNKIANKPKRVSKVLSGTSPTDKIANAVITRIRNERSIFAAMPTKVVGDVTTRGFEAKIGDAMVYVGRDETPGKKTNPISARAFIKVQPKDGALVTITGAQSALAWKNINKVYATHHGAKKVQIPKEAVDSALKALGL